MGVLILGRQWWIKILSPFTLLSSLFGINSKSKEYKIIVNYNGQADLLLSLQITPDYYPYQFKKPYLYDYLTNTDKYLITNENTSPEKQKLRRKLQERISGLLQEVKEFGPGLWDKSMYEGGLEYRNDQFWNNKKTSLLFLEQFILDEYKDISDAYELLPKHKNLIITNHRAARDPYTIFSKDIFECIKEEDGCQENKKSISNGIKKYLNDYDQVEIDSLYRTGKYIYFWNDLKKHKESYDLLGVDSWIKEKKLFDEHDQIDKEIAEKYAEFIFSKKEQEQIKKWDQNWKLNYLTTTHHPVFENQSIPGTSPVSEGSQKDLMMYLFQIAIAINEFSKHSEFNEIFKNDFRKEAIKNAIYNALEISKNFKERTKKIRDYFKKIGVVDSSFNPENNQYNRTNSKVFSIVTFPPTSFGNGDIVIQSTSKYPFIYHDIGLKQAIPKSISSHVNEESHHEHNHEQEKEIFSIDDNGWWWNLGNSNIDPTKLIQFKNSSDTILTLANDEDWNLLKSKSSASLPSIGSLLKDKNKSLNYGKYNLWNEGLRSPIALNLLLDNLVDIFQKEYDTSLEVHKDDYKSAMDWGDYWHNKFIQGEHCIDQTKITK